MMNLSSFARGFISATAKPYKVVSTGAIIKGTTTADILNLNSDSFATTADLSGELLQDGDTFYLVDKLSVNFSGVWRGVIFRCQGLVSVSRYPESMKDSFNRPIDSKLTLVTDGINIHFIAGTAHTIQTPIMQAQATRRQAYVQTSAGIEKMDTLTTQTGTTYKVVDTEIFSWGLSRLFLEQLA